MSLAFSCKGSYFSLKTPDTLGYIGCKYPENRNLVLFTRDL